MMGFPDGWLDTDPPISNTAKKRLCGNAVVPRQAEAAVRLLLARRAELDDGMATA